MTALAGNWLAHLLQAAWQSTAVALIVLALLRILRDASPRLRHALVLLALAKFALPPMLPLPTGIFSAAPPASSMPLVHEIVAAAMRPRVAAVAVALMLLHLAGIAFCVARLTFETWRLHGIRRRATAMGGALFTSDEIAVPMAAGVLRPAILLPSRLVRTLGARELADVIAHEREHVRRRDVLLNWLQELVLAIWWCHPLAHLLGAEGRALREECCDDALLARGTCDRARYASTLLQAATFAARPPLAALAIAESPHALLRRLRRIAAPGFAPSLRLRAGAILLIVLLALTLLPGLRISSSNRFAFDQATRAALRHGHAH